VIANSLDAVSANGTLWLRLTAPVLTNGSFPMARLTVADNGTGILPENLARIFEPFFTTKQTYGTGLGLWVTKELVGKQAGRIRVRSAPGRGTVVSIWMPMERRREERQVA
jgi:signal transduction histidine kinase